VPSYWYSHVVFERGLALIYLVAFLVAVNQFVPLLGERGLLPAVRFIHEVPFRASLRNPATGAASRTWQLGGKLDGVVRDAAGRCYVLEHKCLPASATVFDHTVGRYVSIG
jgi:hypothetical protein